MPIAASQLGETAGPVHRRTTSWLLSVMIFLSYFARDGRYQAAITAAAVALVVALIGCFPEFGRRCRVSVVLPYVAWSIVSMAWSDFPVDSARQAANLGVWTLVGLMLAMTHSIDEVAAIWGRAAKALIGTASVATLLALQGQSLREGPFISKNHLGFAVASSLIPLIAMTWSRSRPRAAAWIALALALSALVNSQTGVVLAIAVPIGYSLASVGNRRRFDHRTVIAVTVALFVLTIAASRADQLLDASAGALGRTTELSGRDLIWPAVVDEASKRPWVGTGLGGVWLHPELEPTASILRALPFELRVAAGHAHNGYLDAWLQTGLVGLALFVLVIFAAGRRAFTILRSSVGVVAAMPIVGVMLVAVGNVTESRFYNDNAWVVIAMVASLSTYAATSHHAGGPMPATAGRDHVRQQPLTRPR